uniref:SOS response-associated peptidase family protein n=1 Tax=Halomonas sp. TaxID=1486246 RepID=UPI002621FCEF|nr:SOS response-associated peptidase family protein [Halomonas sp.]
MLARIWAEYEDGSACCAIITEPARGAAKEVHDRMPLALDDVSLELWMDSDITDRETIRSVVRHIPAELVTHWPVSREVNRSGVEGSELVEPVST